MNQSIERRVFNAEIRVKSSGKGPVIRGIAAIFNSLSENLGGFREIILPGAFSDALPNADVRALINHDPNLILGRTTSGTLRLSETDKGLEFDVDSPDTTYARDLAVSMGRGDISQCSFGFSIADGGDSWQKDAEGMWTRTITRVSRLYDVSPVTYPAYPDTTCAMRSFDKIRAAETPAPFNDIDLRKMRLQIESIV